jgi:hypothetical protein
MREFQAPLEASNPAREYPALQDIHFLLFFVGPFPFLDTNLNLNPDPRTQWNPDPKFYLFLYLIVLSRRHSETVCER